MRNKWLSGAASAALLLGAGSAAHAQAPIYNWTGFYLGLNAGGAWGNSNANTSLACATPALAYFCDSTGVGAANATAVSAAGTGAISANTFTGGVQAGYNWQANNIIYGLETDYGLFKLSGSRQGSANYPSAATGNVATANAFRVGSSFSTDWLFTLRGRLGLVLPSNLMAYATGGLALTNVSVSNSFSDNVGVPGAMESASGSSLKTGWVVGGGLEWALSDHWTVKGEYLYFDFGQVLTVGGTITNPTQGTYAQGISTSSDLTAQVARVGLNYKF